MGILETDFWMELFFDVAFTPSSMMMLQNPPNPEIMKLQNLPNSEMMMQMLKLKSSADSEMLKSIMPIAPNIMPNTSNIMPNTLNVMPNTPNIMPNAPNNSGDQSSCDKCFNRLENLEKLVIARLDQQDAKLEEILKLLQK